MAKNSRQLSVFLENTGSLLQELHYGPYSRFWWDFSAEKNIVNFSIRLDQQVKIFLNEHDFFLTIKKGIENLPEYYCKSGQAKAIEASLTKAVSIVYAAIFNNSIQYSDHAIMGWNNETILEILKKDIEFFPVTWLVGKYKIFLYAIGCSSCEKWKYVGSGF
ncbi:3192_t:CDS:1 [Funneliformis mosseae]|uniref:3192_t:CDS:1 n=1 Tax=Funneliformis mosseae TaxID=27381 RepID=A0A9N9C6I4_FUNMO|nr:3192_t:CDS:1 [Funneliformis mosseae]